MGIGGALMWPAVLGMTYAMLPEERAALAGGLIIGVAGFGNAVGPLLGGVLTDALSWRWIFFVNVPIAAFARVRHLAGVREPRRRRRAERIDVAGVADLSVGLVSLLLALDQGTDWGWGDPRDPRPVRALRGAARGVRGRRAPRQATARSCRATCCATRVPRGAAWRCC